MQNLLDRLRVELDVRDQLAHSFTTIQDTSLYGEVLGIILNVFRSQFGVFGYIDENNNVVCPSMTQNVWDECQVTGREIIFPHDSWEGVWGEVLKTRKATFMNKDFTVPEGHVPIYSWMGVPVIYNRQLIGILQVANGKELYTEKDLELLETIGSYIAPFLNAKIKTLNIIFEKKVKELKMLKKLESSIKKNVNFFSKQEIKYYNKYLTYRLKLEELNINYNHAKKKYFYEKSLDRSFTTKSKIKV